MSPTRPCSTSSRRNSDGFKPYTRGVTPIMLPSMSDPTHNAETPGRTAFENLPCTPNTPVANKKNGRIERQGFPTYEQYKQVEAAYLQSLTPRRQGKALISQAMFDRIWDVLHQPESQNETAQFRFWARKMFTLSKTHRILLGATDNGDQPPQEVLLHDNLLVAIQEQLYDLLCYCHGSTGHGGRDKTCALIRKHYTWVPKDLVATFIKACPTCIMKKCGGVDPVAFASRVAEEVKAAGTYVFENHNTGSPSMSAQVSSSAAASSVPWPHMDSPGSHMSPALSDDPLEAAYRKAVLRGRVIKSSLSGLGVPSSRGLQSLPMSREVSLYKGLPNGWQYKYDDYATAHAEFMKTKNMTIVEDGDLGVHAQRPRVPSIAPLWGPDQFPQSEYESLQADLNDAKNLQSALEHVADNQRLAQEADPFLFFFAPQSEQKAKDEQQSLSQIDPLLMEPSASTSAQNLAEGDAPLSFSPGANHELARSLPTSPSLKRTAASLPRLNLDFPTEKSFQELMAYRDSMGHGGITPDSPLLSMPWPPSNPSPTSSEDSPSSQLSAFPLPMSTTLSMSPASSALPTPVDECSEAGKGMIMIKGKHQEANEVQDVDLSDGIHEACAL